MKQIYIVGAGGFGREVFDWMMETLDIEMKYSFAGFLDDNLEHWMGFQFKPQLSSKDINYNGRK